MATLNEITGGGNMGQRDSRLVLPDIPKNNFTRFDTLQDIKDIFDFQSASTPDVARNVGQAINEAETLPGKIGRGAVGLPLIGGTVVTDVGKAITEAGFDIAKIAFPKPVEDFTMSLVQDAAEIPFVARALEAAPDLLATEDDPELLQAAEGFAGSFLEIMSEFTGGKAIKPVVKQGFRLADAATPSRVRSLLNRTDKYSRGEADEALRRFYQEQLDRNSPLREALAKVARVESTGSNRVTTNTLVDDLIESGIFPTLRDRNFDFEETLFDVNQQIRSIGQARAEIASRVPGMYTLNKLATEALENAKKFGDGTQTDKYAAEIRRQMKSLQRTHEGRRALTKAELNDLIIKKSQKTKAFSKEQFELDVDSAIQRAAQQAFMKGISRGSSIYRGNETMSRLFRVQNALKKMSGKKVKLNPLIDAMGRYLGAVAVGGGIATGSGSIVIAGLAAHLGGDALLKLILNKKLNPQVRAAMIVHARKDQNLVREMLQEADTVQERRIAETLLLPERAGQGQSPTIKVPPAGEANRFDIPTQQPGIIGRTIDAAKNQFDEAKKGPGGTKGGRIGIPWKPVRNSGSRNASKEATELISRYNQINIDLGTGIELAMDLIKKWKSSGSNAGKKEVLGAIDFVNKELRKFRE